MRADVFITGQLTKYSRSSLEGLFDSGCVTLGKGAIKAGHKLRAGDKVKVDTSTLETEPAVIDLPIIYEDIDVAVLNKPAGILTHSKGALNTEATVASFIKLKITDQLLTGNRAGIVHRLDRMTSGVIITAKNEPALKWLQKQFSTRKVKKTYIAVAEGVPKEREAIVDAPIGRNPKKPQTFKVLPTGKAAQTHYKVIEVINKAGKAYSLLELIPRTGRTHQLRVHLAYIGHSIVGDSVYGKAGDHLMLHAKSLELILPDKTARKFVAPIPSYIKDFAK